MNQYGQALVMLIAFVALSVTITSAAVILTIGNSLSSQRSTDGTLAFYIAESGAENALLRLLRDPNYIGVGDTFSVDGGMVSITVTGGTTKTIISEGKLNNFSRRVQVITSYVNNLFTVQSWKEYY